MAEETARDNRLSVKNRALYKAMGFTDVDLARPRIGIANTWSETSPGHIHLRTVAEAVKAGVWQAGGMPIEFSDFAQCPVYTAGGISRYDTPSRDILAASVEACCSLHAFDGLVLISSCDKNVPAHLLAAARLDIPAIYVPGGYMAAGTQCGREVIVTDIPKETILEFLRGETEGLHAKQLKDWEDSACPGPGACALLGTANTMQCLMEALGLALPGSTPILAGSARQLRLAREAGRRIVALVEKDIRPSRILTKEAIENAIAVLCAIGGSTNAVVHIMALVEELGLKDVTVKTLKEITEKTPQIVDVRPGGAYTMDRFAKAGGTIAVMKCIKSLLHCNAMTVSGKTVQENLSEAVVCDPEVIRPLTNPVAAQGLKILNGNLCNYALARVNAVPPALRRFEGPARVFNGQEEALEALRLRKIQSGDVVVVRYEGPRGGPGLTETLVILEAMGASGLTNSCALVTDGKMSGFAKGCYVCQVSPEAAVGGPLAVVRDGDILTIDVDEGTLNIQLTARELDRRLEQWKPPRPRINHGFLALYAKCANPPERGAGLPLRI